MTVISCRKARLLRPCRARGNVDAIAERVVTVDHDIADMQADAQLHAPPRSLWLSRPAPRRALHGTDRAGEVGDDAVAGCVKDAAPCATRSFHR